MKIAIDISLLKKGNFLKHTVRGSGYYLRNLIYSLKKYFPENEYILFTDLKEVQTNIDVVHYPYFEPFFLTLPFPKKGKKVVTVHDLTPLVFPEKFPSGLRGKIKWEIQKRALQNANVIITDSESSKKDICRFTGISSFRIKVVYLAAGEHFRIVNGLKEKIIKKYKLPPKFVLYVGDATWNKNLIRFIDAIEIVDIPLVMVGKALSDEEIEKVDINNKWNNSISEIREKIKNNKSIYRLGYISDNELVAIYNAATLLCMPSFYEGFGLPVLEAMACGCPVVTSNRGSLSEIGADAVEYVNPEITSEIANKINNLYFDNEKLEILKKKGLSHVKKFSWKKVAEETIKAYEEINI